MAKPWVKAKDFSVLKRLELEVITYYSPFVQHTRGIHRDTSIAWRTSTYSLTLNLCTLIIFRIASMRHHRHRSSLHLNHRSAVTPKHISKHCIALAHVVPCGAVAQRNTRENSCYLLPLGPVRWSHYLFYQGYIVLQSRCVRCTSDLINSSSGTRHGLTGYLWFERPFT